MRWMAVALVITLAAPPAMAQRTADQARLSLGLAAGATTGTKLWSVAGQPIFDGPSQVDTVLLSRRTKGSLAVVFHGTYFPGEHWGFTGEAMLLGLGFEDACEISFASGSSRNAQVCNSINGDDERGTAVSLSVGTMYRVWSQKIISPYARVHAGLVVSQHSSVQMDGTIVDSNQADPIRFRLYDDPTRRQVSPVLGLGVGFTAALGRGYQLRWELRDNIVGIDEVTGPTFGTPNLEPPHKMAYTHVWSVTFGFDVVLERRRGRRY